MINSNRPIEEFAPLFEPDNYSDSDKYNLSPFFTNIDKSVCAPLIVSPELVGALCSRTSRAPKDIRYHYLNEFILPFVSPEMDGKDTGKTWQEKNECGESLRQLIKFLHKHSALELFSNPQARTFYTKWLAEFGDDSIAQMAGTYMAFSGISQLAIKHFEDQRIGLAPIEKSTRYVNYSQKTKGKYLYYTDPTLEDFGFKKEYENVMDNLFLTYSGLNPKLSEQLSKKYPEEKLSVIEKKSFDTLRYMLPVSTLSQVTFFGNGQAFEYAVNRSAKHRLGEIRWAGQRIYEELNQVTPSFFRRTEKETAQEYQKYLAEKGERVAPMAKEIMGEDLIAPITKPEVCLVEYDPEGQEKIIAGIIFSAPGNHYSWEKILEKTRKMSDEDKRKILAQYLSGRTARWQKVGRAFENAYMRFEIVMDIGGWRDLHRHRMLTQQRQDFSCKHGYDIPTELIEAGLDKEFSRALDLVGELYEKISARDSYLAQYSVSFAHRIRFMQWENLRQSFWQTELRTIPEGHPSYRHIEQEKFKLIKKAYPLIAEHMLVNLGDYVFARRGQEEKIQKKSEELSK